MSTTVDTGTTLYTPDVAAVWSPPRPIDGPGLSLPRLIRSEWIKLRTLRSTWLTLGLAMLVLVVAGGLIANHLHGDLMDPRRIHGGDPSDHDVLAAPFNGFGVSQLVIGVLGVLAVTGEYATGMIRASFTAVPKRLPVLWAKMTVFGGLAAAAMLIASLGTFFVSQGVLGSFGVGLGHTHALRIVVGLAGYLALVGLLGLGLGFMIRSTAGSIAALVGILLVAPGILAAFQSSWATTLSHYLPLAAGQAMFRDLPGDPGTLSPGGGTLVMVLWVVASTIGAGVLVKSRDA